MLYKVIMNDENESCVVLGISPDVLNLPGVIIADRNASSGWVKFAPPESGLAGIDKDIIFAEYWTHDNPTEESRHKSKMCAEVLVPSHIDYKYLMNIQVSCLNDKKKLEKFDFDKSIIVDKHMFFK